MTSRTISAENLGPIAGVEFSLDTPGVTVLVAPNGSGKSILLDAVQAAARGEGKLPLRDRTRRGKVEAFGATITIGGTCRHTGSFEVTNLEGRFDLASLVDPRIKTPAAADKARIKALVSLTGVEASVDMFRNHESFADFDEVVTAEALATDDPVEMAAKIKSCYDDAALAAERRSEREFGQAAALIPPSDVNLDDESDPAILQEAYNVARDELARLTEQARNADAWRMRTENAQKMLKELGEDSLQLDLTESYQFIEESQDILEDKYREIVKLESQLAEVRASVKGLADSIKSAETRIVTIKKQLALVDEAKKMLAEVPAEIPDEDDLADAQAECALAAAAIEQGVKIRAAKNNAMKVQNHRQAAKEHQDKAGRYRDAGKATDEVLSGCIKCDQLRVESDGKTARLVTDHPLRGASIPYHDLSDGEKWTIAIDIGADQVGEGGLLVISQVGWEGIDGANRKAIHDHAVKRGVFILTAEAASDPNATRDIVPTPMGTTPVTKPASPAKVDPPKEKPSPAPKAKAAKAPVKEDLYGDEEIPF